MFRITCPSCAFVFMLLTPADDSGVICPHCGVVFQPEEEEIYDPEDD
ncbi:MAG: hypothetical protein HY660_01260 [Armatimonadetes bacterium]|nr:hypothetical protein [Armatimonadota bacterium]